MKIAWLALALATGLTLGAARAQMVGPPPLPAEPLAEADAPAPVPSYRLTGWLSRYQPNSTVPAANSNGYGLGVIGERELPSRLRYGLELLVFGTDYEAPTGLSCGSFCVVSPTMQLRVWGFGGTLGYGARLGRLEVNAGAGLGMYYSTMTATASTLGFPGTHSENSAGVGTDLRLGLGLELARDHWLGLQLRQLALNGNFGPLSKHQDMQIGGSFVLLTYTVTR